jgi:hypothetical protein
MNEPRAVHRLDRRANRLAVNTDALDQATQPAEVWRDRAAFDPRAVLAKQS